MVIIISLSTQYSCVLRAPFFFLPSWRNILANYILSASETRILQRQAITQSGHVVRPFYGMQYSFRMPSVQNAFKEASGLRIFAISSRLTCVYIWVVLMLECPRR